MPMKSIAHLLRQLVLLPAFTTSRGYWERRYRLGGTSGAGSYGEEAAFKAEVVNRFVRDNAVHSIVEFGCGDGNQLTLAAYPLYLGLDVSKKAIQLCRDRFRDDPSKSFLWYDPEHTVNIANFVEGDLTLSLDVVFHLVEDRVYKRYLDDLFATSRRFVMVYSTDRVENSRMPHVRHRAVSTDAPRWFPEFRRLDAGENGGPASADKKFLVFERSSIDRSD